MDAQGDPPKCLNTKISRLFELRIESTTEIATKIVGEKSSETFKSGTAARCPVNSRAAHVVVEDCNVIAALKNAC